MLLSKIWTVYIIQALNGNLYTGITTDLGRRLENHKNKKGARFFNFSQPKQIMYQESHLNRSEASKRENEIKKMTRQSKLELIQNSPDVKLKDEKERIKKPSI